MIRSFLLTIVCLLATLLPLSAQTPPKHEVRAAWITAVYGLDWPRAKATSAAGIRKQQEELVLWEQQLLEHLNSLHKMILM